MSGFSLLLRDKIGTYRDLFGMWLMDNKYFPGLDMFLKDKLLLDWNDLPDKKIFRIIESICI